MQEKLFDAPQQLTNGLVYRPNFITPEEEAVLLIMIEHAPLSHSTYTIHTLGEKRLTRKRAVWFPAPLPRWLTPLQLRVAKWLDVPKNRIAHALIQEYLPGTGMGFHRDKEPIEHVVGISLGNRATMRFRPYQVQDTKEMITLEVEPRSAYIMQKAVHQRYQHAVMPVKHLRHSITFRTLRT